MAQREFIISTSLIFSVFPRCQFIKLIQGNIHVSVSVQLSKQFRKGQNQKFRKGKRKLIMLIILSPT